VSTLITCAYRALAATGAITLALLTCAHGRATVLPRLLLDNVCTLIEKNVLFWPLQCRAVKEASDNKPHPPAADTAAHGQVMEAALLAALSAPFKQQWLILCLKPITNIIKGAVGGVDAVMSKVLQTAAVGIGGLGALYYGQASDQMA